jgi:hypothetical protein
MFIDADNDGMDDAWEVTHGLIATVDDRNGDLDADGLTNIEEYVTPFAMRGSRAKRRSGERREVMGKPGCSMSALGLVLCWNTWGCFVDNTTCAVKKLR